MTKDFAWFLGWLHSDGYIPKEGSKQYNKGVMQFICKHSDTEVLHKIKNILKTKFDRSLFTINRYCNTLNFCYYFRTESSYDITAGKSSITTSIFRCCSYTRIVFSHVLSYGAVDKLPLPPSL